jgi:hypothetical protein
MLDVSSSREDMGLDVARQRVIVALGSAPDEYHREVPYRPADPTWMKPAAVTVMAGLVPAIRSGRVPRPMAGTGPAMTVRAGFIKRASTFC